MKQYVEFVADHLLVELGIDKVIDILKRPVIIKIFKDLQSIKSLRLYGKFIHPRQI